jgi:acyl-CoA thioesterase-1
MNGKIFQIAVLCLLSVSCQDNSSDRPKQQDTEQKKEVKKNRTLVFFGDSLTAGYGLDEPSLAFPGLIQLRLDSAGIGYQVVNAGVSGETSSGGVERIDWILSKPVDIFVLELGANDGLRGIPIDATTKNLQLIIDKVRAKNSNAKIILAGMQVPPNMGERYTSAFKAMFPALAKKNNIELVPFLLEGVGGEIALNQADGIHPTIEGHKIVADNVWPYILKATEQ